MKEVTDDHLGSASTTCERRSQDYLHLTQVGKSTLNPTAVEHSLTMCFEWGPATSVLAMF